MTNVETFLLCRGSVLIAEIQAVVAKFFFAIHEAAIINKEEFDKCMSASFVDYDKDREYSLETVLDLWITKRIPPPNAKTREMIREYYWCPPNTYVMGTEAVEMSFCNHLKTDGDEYRVVPAYLQFFGNDDAPAFEKGTVAEPDPEVTKKYLAWKEGK